MDQHDARRIAETGNALRPDWPIGSLMTILAEHKHRAPIDVHLAVVWIAYDPTIKTPAILRTDGPWWHIVNQTRTTGRTLPYFKPAEPSEPVPPERIARLRHAKHGQPKPGCPYCNPETKEENS